MNQIEYITKLIKDKEYFLVSVLNNEGQIIDSYDIWFDDDICLYCFQKLYVDKGKIEEIGGTITCTKYELERILSLIRIGTLDVEVVQ